MNQALMVRILKDDFGVEIVESQQTDGWYTFAEGDYEYETYAEAVRGAFDYYTGE